MSGSATWILAVTVVLAVLLAVLTLASGFGLLAAFLAYSFGGSFCLLAIGFSAAVEQGEFRRF